MSRKKRDLLREKRQGDGTFAVTTPKIQSTPQVSPRTATATINLSLIVQEADWRLLHAVIAASEKKYGECSWFGIGSISGNEMRISSIIYPDQENSRGESDMPSDTLASTLASVCRDGNRVLWWGHSHGNMGTFYSPTDEGTWRQWTGGNPEVFLGSCHNIKGEVYTRLRLGAMNLELDRLPIFVLRPPVPEESVVAAMEKMRAKPFPVVSDWKNYMFGDGWSGNAATPTARGSADAWRSKPPAGSVDTAGACRILDAVAGGAGIRLVNSDGARGKQNEKCPAWRDFFGRQPTLMLSFDDASSLRMYQGAPKDHPYVVHPTRGSSALIAAAYIGCYREIVEGKIENASVEMLNSKTATNGWYTAIHHIVYHFLRKWETLDLEGRREVLGASANVTDDEMTSLEYYLCGDDVLLWMMLQRAERLGTIVSPPFLDLKRVREIAMEKPSKGGATK